MLTLEALGLIPASINSSLWAGLLEDCGLVSLGEYDWKGLVAMMDHSGKRVRKLWSTRPEALLWNTG